MYEIGNYIYVFFREVAIEYINCGKAGFSVNCRRKCCQTFFFNDVFICLCFVVFIYFKFVNFRRLTDVVK